MRWRPPPHRIREYHLRQKDSGFQLLAGGRQHPRHAGRPGRPGGALCPRRQGELPLLVLMNAIPAAVAGCARDHPGDTPVGGDRCGAGRRRAGGGDPHLPRRRGAGHRGAGLRDRDDSPGRQDRGPGQPLGGGGQAAGGGAGGDRHDGGTDRAGGHRRRDGGRRPGGDRHDRPGGARRGCHRLVRDDRPAAGRGDSRRAGAGAWPGRRGVRSRAPPWTATGWWSGCPARAEAVQVVNLRAPEHLDDPDPRSGGGGRGGPSRRRDLPGRGFARSRSGTTSPAPATCCPPAGPRDSPRRSGVYDFVKRTSIVWYNRSRLLNDADRIIVLAAAEGLPGHAEAVRVRVRDGE